MYVASAHSRGSASLFTGGEGGVGRGHGGAYCMAVGAILNAELFFTVSLCCIFCPSPVGVHLRR